MRKNFHQSVCETRREKSYLTVGQFAHCTALSETPINNFYVMWQANGCFVFLFQVKNKAPAPVQITAEQLLREAKERQLELVPAVSRYHVYFLASCAFNFSCQIHVNWIYCDPLVRYKCYFYLYF